MTDKIPETPIDYLAERGKQLAQRYIESGANKPIEFTEIPEDRLVKMLSDQLAPLLRKIEDDMFDAAIERTASLIRYHKLWKKAK